MRSSRLISSSFRLLGARSALPLARGTRRFSSHASTETGRVARSLIFAGVGLAGLYLFSSKKAYSEEATIAIAKEDEEDANPSPPEPIVVEYKYVIIGAGTAGHAALQAIFQKDPKANVLMLSGEPSLLPYARPPLSKNLWNSEDPQVATNLKFHDWEGKENSIWYDEIDYIKDPRVVISGRKVVDIDHGHKLLMLDDEKVVKYEKCLIATGGDPRVLPGTENVAHVSTFRTVEDFKKLDQVVRQSKHIVIVGGGFLGSELAWGLKKRGVEVTQIFPETGVLATTFPRYLSDYATDVGRKAGIEILPETLVDKVDSHESGVNLTLNNGTTLNADHVVVAAGLVPSTHLAKSGGLEIDPVNKGIVANAELEVRTDLFVAGDVASYYDIVLGERRRIEHHNHAESSGRIAGENMACEAGEKHKPYAYQPFFWSDVGPIGFEAVGIVDSRLPTVAFFEKPEGENPTGAIEYKKGIIYYMRGDAVVGVLLLGTFGKVSKAREIIKMRKPHAHAELQRAITLEEEEHH